MTALTKQDEARIVELARKCESQLFWARDMEWTTPGGRDFHRTSAERASAEAFRIATSASTALRALCEAGYAPVSELVACGGGR